MKKHIVFDLETSGLNPFECRITAVGVKTGEEEVVMTSEDEKALLIQFWDYLRRVGYFALLGFNSSGFDIPFLIIRSLKHNVKMIDLRGKSIDLKLLLSYGNRYAKGKLDDYAKLIGLEGKNGNGEQAVKLWEEGKVRDLSRYVLQDVRITYALFERAKENGII